MSGPVAAKRSKFCSFSNGPAELHTDFAMAGNAYSFYPGPANWADARSACQARGMDLATIESAAVWDLVNSRLSALVPSGRDFVWLGGNRLNTADALTWAWADGSPWSYAAWDLSFIGENGAQRPQPDGPLFTGSVAEKCVMSYRTYGGRHDVNCILSGPFLCASLGGSPARAASAGSKLQTALPPLSRWLTARLLVAVPCRPGCRH